MNTAELTGAAPLAIVSAMETGTDGMERSRRRGARALVMVMGLAMLSGLSGCISVSAPDKPIVIELNINIKQEVVYKLDKGVQQMIDQNSGIF